MPLKNLHFYPVTPHCYFQFSLRLSAFFHFDLRGFSQFGLSPPFLPALLHPVPPLHHRRTLRQIALIGGPVFQIKGLAWFASLMLETLGSVNGRLKLLARTQAGC